MSVGAVLAVGATKMRAKAVPRAVAAVTRTTTGVPAEAGAATKTTMTTGAPVAVATQTRTMIADRGRSAGAGMRTMIAALAHRAGAGTKMTTGIETPVAVGGAEKTSPNTATGRGAILGPLIGAI